MSRNSRTSEDELDQVVGGDDSAENQGTCPPAKARKSSKSKHRKGRSAEEDNQKGIVKESMFPSMKTIFVQSRSSLNPLWLWGQGMRTLMLHPSTWSAGLPYLIIGLMLAFIGEVMKDGPQHNVVILLVLMAAFAFPNFPDKTVRPQLVIVLITSISFVLDINVFSKPAVDIGVKAVTALVVLAKGLALYQFLWYTKNAAKARKYFVRRIRVFLIPWARPKNIMRELRSRILAVEVLQFVCIIAYVALFFVAIINLAYSDLVTGPRRGVALAAFLPLKAVSSGAVFYGLLTDTDPILCLAHFGILGGCMKSVKSYVRKKFEEYEGWPLAYGLNKYRFYVVTFVKFVDWCWGFAGWAALGTVLGERYYGLADSIKAFVGCSVFIMCLSDIYIPLLFAVIFWLMNENKHHLEVKVREHKASGELTAEFDDGDRASDDSELDDFGFRAAVERDLDVEEGVELGRSKAAFSPDKFARGSRVDYSKTLRWGDDDHDSHEVEKKKKKKKHKQKHHKKHKKHHRLSSESDEDDDSTGDATNEDYDRFGSSRTASNVAKTSKLQSLVDNDEAPRYMRGRVPDPADNIDMDDSQGGETTVEFANHTPAPPPAGSQTSRGSSFVSPRSSSGMLPPLVPPQEQAGEPRAMKRNVIKVPPLQIRRAASEVAYPDATFKRPLIGSQNSMDIGGVDNYNSQKGKMGSIPVGKGDSILDWRSADSNPVPPPHHNVISSPTAAAAPIASRGNKDIVIQCRELTPEEYSSLWDSLGPGDVAQYQLSASSALDPDDMLVVIVEHFKNAGFGIAASGVVSGTLTVFCFSSSVCRGNKSVEFDTFLIEIKLVQLSNDINTDGKLSWQLEYICKCTDPSITIEFLKKLQLNVLLGTDEILFDEDF